MMIRKPLLAIKDGVLCVRTSGLSPFALVIEKSEDPTPDPSKDSPKPSKDTDNKDLPKTGDDSTGIWLFIGLMVMSGCAAICVMIISKRQKNK